MAKKKVYLLLIILVVSLVGVTVFCIHRASQDRTEVSAEKNKPKDDESNDKKDKTEEQVVDDEAESSTDSKKWLSNGNDIEDDTEKKVNKKDWSQYSTDPVLNDLVWEE